MRNRCLSQTKMAAATESQLVGSVVVRAGCPVLPLDIVSEKRHSEDHALKYIAQMHPASAGVPP